ncbi:helix-turn-helix transcriptional regulator [Acidimangrovimonas sediminis]|uniref:helix-turn-helix transcriptional regulator n=1 Tax=Acidimangrovimonas sediminis TaxID=2056283 RepID=UPI000C80ED64|nr:LuxR family transcriptional regulator [Acidimangrovimonas sediminis]
MALLQDVNRLLDAPTVDAVWTHLLARMQSYGFGRLLYACTRAQTGNRLGAPENALMLTNHSKEYLDRFIGDGLYRDAPMVRWANENRGVCNWRCIDEMVKTGTVTPAEKQVIAFNRRHGLTAGLTISFTALAVRSKGGIGLVAREGLTHDDVDAIWQAHGEEILALCRIAHLRIICLPHPQAGNMLSPRQREALEWVAEGKTTLDIAVLMGVSAATVEKHLRLARESLEVESTAQAIAKATMMNQIFTVET